MKSFLPALLLLTIPALAQHPAYESDPGFLKEVAAAKQQHQPLEDQISHWKKAGKLARGACLPCLEQVAFLSLRTNELKDAITFANSFEQAATKPIDKSSAELIRGSALLRMKDGKPSPDQLAQADAAFKAATANDPTQHTSLYLDGLTLARADRDEDARTLFAAYVQATPASDRFHLRSQHFAENPALARAKMAPPFTVTTAEGKSFTLDDMGGRVVLVDFWATWCGPCNQELPHIKKIAQEFAGQPFVLISVSWDSDPATWQGFVDKNGMSWNQYRDADRLLSRAYGVDAIPHYFTIDSDGVLQSEVIGSGTDIEGKLRKLVTRAKAAPAPIRPSAPEGN